MDADWMRSEMGSPDPAQGASGCGSEVFRRSRSVVS